MVTKIKTEKYISESPERLLKALRYDHPGLDLSIGIRYDDEIAIYSNEYEFVYMTLKPEGEGEERVWVGEICAYHHEYLFMEV